MREKAKQGYQLIDQYRNALVRAEKAPQYYAGGYSTDGEPFDIVENIGPWDEVQKAADAQLPPKPRQR